MYKTVVDPELTCAQVRVRNTTDGHKEFFEIDPDQPYEETLIISSQPGQLDDYTTGLSDVRFWVKDFLPWQVTNSCPMITEASHIPSKGLFATLHVVMVEQKECGSIPERGHARMSQLIAV